MSHSAFRTPHSPFSRRGVTLIEMLVAIAVSLIVMYAVIRIFDQLNDGMNRSKAIIEQAGELRNVTQRLRQDLDGLTASTLPWTVPDAGDGYLEYLEGPGRDSDEVITPTRSMWGDRDDILMFTSRSKGRPFVGRYGGGVIESELAEIIWWPRYLGDLNGNTLVDPQEVALYRRVLLIRPDIAPTGSNVSTFLESNDISVRLEGGSLKANSLADLTQRKNRIFHTLGGGPGGFPHALDSTKLVPIPSTNEAFGTDLVLDKVVAFDVRVYDPYAPLMGRDTGNALVDPATAANAAVVIGPGDPSYTTAILSAPSKAIGRGAYVDLGYAAAAGYTPDPRSVSFYSGQPNARSGLAADSATPLASPVPTYSTWPLAYEQDGLNQDVASEGASPLTDEGRDGFDNGGAAGAIDDPGEYETLPPYPHPITGQKTPGLRGIQVRIRIMENDSRSVRQSSVVSNFVPE